MAMTNLVDMCSFLRDLYSTDTQILRRARKLLGV